MTAISALTNAASYAGRQVDMLGGMGRQLRGPGGRALKIGLFGSASAPLSHPSASVGRQQIAAAIERLGGEVVSFNAQSTMLDRNGRLLVAEVKEHGGAVLRPLDAGLDAVLARGGGSLPVPALDALAQLETAHGIPVLSSSRSIAAAQSKATTAELLERAGVPTPRTAIIDHASAPSETERAVAELASLDEQGRVVVKVPQGTQGKGVVVAADAGQATDVIGLLQDARSGAEQLIRGNGASRRPYQDVVVSGVDGARAGEMLLRRHPDAQLRASVAEAAERFGLPLRVQVRTPDGLSRSVLVDSESAARQVAEAHWANEKLAIRVGVTEPTLDRLDRRLLVQEFVPEAGGNDIRAFTMRAADGNYDVVASMERVAAEGETRANLHQGGTAVPRILTEEAREIAARAAGALDMHIGGVDLLESGRGLLVVEINSSPGFGIAKATGVDVPRLVGELAMREAHRAAHGLAAPA